MLYEYLKKYQEDPRSRVFAPLAEAYRKAGMVDEAIEVAREGMAIHPQFVGGRVALARALFDKKEYELVLKELEDVIQNAPDNLVAQRLVGESALMMGFVTRALISFKMLLIYQPQDTDLAKLVQELETQAYREGTMVLSENIPQTPEAQKRNRQAWIARVEKLQGLLQKVERYRANTR